MASDGRSVEEAEGDGLSLTPEPGSGPLHRSLSKGPLRLFTRHEGDPPWMRWFYVGLVVVGAVSSVLILSLGPGWEESRLEAMVEDCAELGGSFERKLFNPSSYGLKGPLAVIDRCVDESGVVLKDWGLR